MNWWLVVAEVAGAAAISIAKQLMKKK